jgi:hypothetical protein
MLKVRRLTRSIFLHSPRNCSGIITIFNEIQRRRIKIRSIFAGVFAFLSYFKGFGAAIGGFLGWVAGGAVGKIS